jgi:DNA-binding response OmpR family regulator
MGPSPIANDGALLEYDGDCSENDVICTRVYGGLMTTNTSRSDRSEQQQPFGYAFDQVVLELAGERITVDGQNVASPPLPFRLLHAICERPGMLVHRKDLFEFIWPRQIATNEALSKVISRLRDLLGPYGARVVTVRSRGVRLDATVRRLDAPVMLDASGTHEQIEPMCADPQGIVLIVDDSAESITLLTETLKDRYKTKIATNGASAIKAATRTPQPDVILMDITMPGMDGYELCQMLKSLPNTADIPVIFLTGKVEPADEAKGFEVGAVDYITKPISQPVVLARTATHLRLARIQRKLKKQNEDLEHLVQLRTNELTQVQDATIVAMASLAETRR